MSSDFRRGARGGATGNAALASEPSGSFSEGDKPSVWEAVGRLAEASQRLMIDRIELARIETREDMQSLIRTMILVFAALPVLLLGWISLLAGLMVILNPVLPYAISLLILGVLHVVVGGGGTYIGVARLKARRASREEAGNEQEEG